MAKPKRQRMEPTEQWEQLELHFTSPQQRQYELIRPVVLFGEPATERARATNTPQRTVARHAQQFLAHGMASLFATPPPASTPRLPPALREAVVALHAEHRALHFREIATICYVRFGRRPSVKTIKRMRAEGYCQVDDPAAGRSRISAILER